jgi:hypothetical protein
MTAMTSAGTKIAVSITPPATNDAAGYAALTFTPVKGVESLAAFGADIAENNFQPLDGPLEKLKGAPNYGSIQVPIALDKSDAGQTIVRNLAKPGNNTLASWMVTYSNGDKRYFGGRVFGAPETVGGANNVMMINPKIGISTTVVEVDAP